MTITIRIPGDPVAQGRPRFSRFSAGRPLAVPVAYDPTSSVKWKRSARVHYVAALRQHDAPRPFAPEGPVEVTVLAVFRCPVSDERVRNPRGRRRHTKTPDADNVAKAAKDAAKGILWRDDSQVSDLHALKRIAAQGEEPYVEVTVEPVPVELVD